MPIFIVFGLTQPGIKPESTVSVADALSTRDHCSVNDRLQSMAKRFYAFTWSERSWIHFRAGQTKDNIAMQARRNEIIECSL